MTGTVSFHPVDVGFFDDVVAPLLAGRKVNPEPFLAEALRTRVAWAAARSWPRAVAALAATVEPPGADPSARLWQRLQANLARFDYRPSEAARRAAAAFEPALHLEGRPFFVTENSPERIADVVEAYRTAPGEAAAIALGLEQLEKLDRELAQGVRPDEGPVLAGDLQYRQELLDGLEQLHGIARAARAGGTWRSVDGDTRPAIDVLHGEVPWRAVRLHSRAVPFWAARDVDGLETICRAAGVPPAEGLVPARRLFAEACEEHAGLEETLRVELRGTRDVGAFVAPAGIGKLLAFLGDHGARIIAAATRAGEGPAAAVLLRKIKECATYAARRGFGYLEASGIEPPDVVE